MKVDGREFGPNMSKLIIHKMTIDAVPPGGDFHSAIDFIMAPGKMETSSKASSEWALKAIEGVRSAYDYTGSKEEEAIAGMILEKLGKRLEEQRRRLLNEAKK